MVAGRRVAGETADRRVMPRRVAKMESPDRRPRPIATAAETIDWLAAPNDDAVTGAGLAGDLIPGAALAEAPLTAVAVEACGEDRTCFVLENADDLSALLLVDMQNYLPVAIRRVPAEGEAAGTQVDLVWGGEVEFVAPEGDTEVTEEELALALLTLALGMVAIEDEPPPPPSTAGDRGSRAEPLAFRNY